MQQTKNKKTKPVSIQVCLCYIYIYMTNGRYRETTHRYALAKTPSSIVRGHTHDVSFLIPRAGQSGSNTTHTAHTHSMRVRAAAASPPPHSKTPPPSHPLLQQPTLRMLMETSGVPIKAPARAAAAEEFHHERKEKTFCRGFCHGGTYTNHTGLMEQGFYALRA